MNPWRFLSPHFGKHQEKLRCSRVLSRQVPETRHHWVFYSRRSLPAAFCRPSREHGSRGDLVRGMFWFEGSGASGEAVPRTHPSGLKASSIIQAWGSYPPEVPRSRRPPSLNRSVQTPCLQRGPTAFITFSKVQMPPEKFRASVLPL